VREGAERESAESTGPSVTSIAVAGRLLWEDHRGSGPHSDRGVFRGGGKNEAGPQETLAREGKTGAQEGKPLFEQDEHHVFTLEERFVDQPARSKLRRSHFDLKASDKRKVRME
jgi:hypothetical protein